MPSGFARAVAGSASPLPPTYIRYLPQGDIVDAWQCEDPYVGKRSRASGAQKAGLAYQRRVLDHLSVLVSGGALVPSPWYCYVDSGGARRYCQPDAIHEYDSSPRALVCEIKLRWTADAWWQLRKLYLPVLSRAYLPSRLLIPLCICRSYDPSVAIPEAVNLIEDLEAASPDQFNVLVIR